MQSEPIKLDYSTKSNFPIYIRYTIHIHTPHVHTTFQFSFNSPLNSTRLWNKNFKEIDIFMNEISDAIHDIRCNFSTKYTRFTPYIKTFPPNIPIAPSCVGTRFFGIQISYSHRMRIGVGFLMMMGGGGGNWWRLICSEVMHKIMNNCVRCSERQNSLFKLPKKAECINWCTSCKMY